MLLLTEYNTQSASKRYANYPTSSRPQSPYDNHRLVANSTTSVHHLLLVLEASAETGIAGSSSASLAVRF